MYSVASYRHKHCCGDNKTNVRAYFYFRYRQKNRQQRRQTVGEFDSVTYSNIGKLIFTLDIEKRIDNTAGATSVGRTAHTSGAHEYK